ncbi:hypothetical protein ACFWH1_10825 [Streptomyces sp. NPDC127037]|uniref:hypothetical protein n=1 Tax=Streptomyces sp. NPDC127037 TaxID=3347113 RepID=UPI0036476144
MKRLTALLSASALSVGSLVGAGLLMPSAAHAEPACGGSVDDWRDLDAAGTYRGTITVTSNDSGMTLDRTVSLEGDTVWVPGQTDKVTYDFTAGALTWYVGGQYGGVQYSLGSAECAQGGTRVTSALYKESAGGVGGGGVAEGRLNRA